MSRYESLVNLLLAAGAPAEPSELQWLRRELLPGRSSPPPNLPRARLLVARLAEVFRSLRCDWLDRNPVRALALELARLEERL